VIIANAERCPPDEATPTRLRRRIDSAIIAQMHDRFEKSELIFDGYVAKGYKVALRMPDGKVVQRDFFHYDGAAVILPVLSDGSIVLIRNRRFAVDEDLLELPAGMLEKGEEPALCAARELTEETGYTSGNVETLGVFYTGPGTTDETMYAFLATDLTNGQQALEDYEEISVVTYSDAEVRRMVLDGTLHDGKTIATLCLYWLSRGLGASVDPLPAPETSRDADHGPA
jgi:ADP-ribose diphosphatase